MTQFVDTAHLMIVKLYQVIAHLTIYCQPQHL